MRIVGINFDHMHMGDLLRMVHEHPETEIAGVCDERPERMASAVRTFGVGSDLVFTDHRRCIETTRPDAIILCPATAEHADWVERVAPYGLPVLIEKPFASSVAEADRMVSAMAEAGSPLAINWPLRWYPSNVTAARLIAEGRIGDVLEVHYYDGNRGPLYHTADKVETTPTVEDKASSWFYRKEAGGGSMLDYLGYGTTLATWFLGGRRPVEVMAMADRPRGLEVDEQSVVVARYDEGLSVFETRWGTFTDPWTHQPQPKCGFVIRGREGTISAYDFESTVRVQTRERPEGENLPVDELRAPERDPVEYFVHCITTGRPVEGPLSPELSRVGQEIVDAAVRSADEGRTIRL